VAGALLSAAGADPEALPCAGDWVVVLTWPDRRVTAEAVLPRRTALVRRAAGRASTGQVLAANLDTAAVVESIDPAPDLNRVERLLALAWQSGARPLVVLTKADLAAAPAVVAAQVAEATAGVPVLPVSAERAAGLDRLRRLVAPGRTLALLGPSGCGKSTLVNALVGAAVMATQRVRRADGKGRHTTTYRALVPVPGGGAVLDTPGVRAVGLLDAGAGLARTFGDLAALVAACRFPDCAHRAEPGCAVRAALASGALAPVGELVPAAPGGGGGGPPPAGAAGRPGAGRPATRGPEPAGGAPASPAPPSAVGRGRPHRRVSPDPAGGAVGPGGGGPRPGYPRPK
jgi:ribosome biogenesis GTPase